MGSVPGSILGVRGGTVSTRTPLPSWRLVRMEGDAQTHTSSHVKVVAPALESNSAEKTNGSVRRGAGKAASSNQLGRGRGPRRRQRKSAVRKKLGGEVPW